MKGKVEDKEKNKRDKRLTIVDWRFKMSKDKISESCLPQASSEFVILFIP